MACSHPLLFDLGSARPSTRDLAAAVRANGVDEALSEAERRADAARYQEVTCRSALNRVAGMPFEWTLNPYRGCTHGCHYCYARRYHTQFELGSGDDFASVILVKRNFVEVLSRELDRPGWRREYVAVGTATDCYQPIEGHYRLTRRSLEALLRARTAAGIVTKGPMIVRDVDLLRALSDAAGCTVYISVPTVDEDAWRRLEPGTAPPLQRLRAVRELADAGLHVGVLMSPIVPGFSSSRRTIERTVKAIADHGARFVGCAVMFLEAGTRDHFMRFLGQEFPAWVPRYERLYARKHAPGDYRREIAGMVRLLQQQHGLPARERDHVGPAPEDGAEQVGFGW